MMAIYSVGCACSVVRLQIWIHDDQTMHSKYEKENQ